jgi:hypothetical protein
MRVKVIIWGPHPLSLAQSLTYLHALLLSLVTYRFQIYEMPTPPSLSFLLISFPQTFNSI